MVGPDVSAPAVAGTTTQPREEFLAQVLDGGSPELTWGEDPNAIAVQLFTSGTTGAPKAAILRHEHLVSYILSTVEFMSAPEEEATLVSVPPYHIAGIAAVISSLYSTRRIVQLPDFGAALWLELCEREQVTNAFVVPTMLSRIIDHLDTVEHDPELHTLRAIAYGGGKMPVKVIERALQLFPEVNFTNAYGLTETSSTITLLAPDDHREAVTSDNPAVRSRLGSVGKALPSVELEIRDDDGNVLGAEEAGEIYVRGPQVSGEYLERNALGADGWFPTRDAGYVDAEGYLFLSGRADDVIVRGGENIAPGEVEDVLLTHDDVLDAAVWAYRPPSGARRWLPPWCCATARFTTPTLCSSSSRLPCARPGSLRRFASNRSCPTTRRASCCAAWSRSCLRSAVDGPGAPAPVAPAPLVRSTQRALDRLRALAAPPLAWPSAVSLLAERAHQPGWRITANCSAGGSCRLFGN